MAKLLAVTIIVIAIASAIPIVMHMWPMPTDISVHGHLIDEQYSDTMLEAGISFLASQFHPRCSSSGSSLTQNLTPRSSASPAARWDWWSPVSSW